MTTRRFALRAVLAEELVSLIEPLISREPPSPAARCPLSYSKSAGGARVKVAAT
jgi:hypothetical protein